MTSNPVSYSKGSGFISHPGGLAITAASRGFPQFFEANCNDNT